MITRGKVVYRFCIWLIVASISAAPSFLIAMAEFDQWAMITGVLMFVVALTALSCMPWFERLRARRFVRATLYSGYGARMLVSLLLPLGVALDMFPGMISLGVVTGLGLDEYSFEGTLLATLIQGTILNIVVLVFMTCLYGLLRVVGPKAPGEGCCTSCGYDLRGTPDSICCPECGGVVAVEAASVSEAA